MQKIKFNYSVFTALILGVILILSILAVPLSFANAFEYSIDNDYSYYYANGNLRYNNSQTGTYTIYYGYKNEVVDLSSFNNIELGSLLGSQFPITENTDTYIYSYQDTTSTSSNYLSTEYKLGRVSVHNNFGTSASTKKYTDYFSVIFSPSIFHYAQTSSSVLSYLNSNAITSRSYGGKTYYRFYHSMISFHNRYGSRNLDSNNYLNISFYLTKGSNNSFNEYLVDSDVLISIQHYVAGVYIPNSEMLYAINHITPYTDWYNKLYLINYCVSDVISAANYIDGFRVSAYTFSGDSFFKYYNNNTTSSSYTYSTSPLLYSYGKNACSLLSYVDWSYNDSYLNNAFLSGGTYESLAVNLLSTSLDADSYDLGYNTGYGSGYTSGYFDGSDYGYNSGYSRGYNLGQLEASDYTFLGLVSAVINAPIRMIFGTQEGEGLLNFDVLGTNLSTFVLSILSLAFVIVVIKFILKAVK